jgi:CBS-domain-containing membrane protein
MQVGETASRELIAIDPEHDLDEVLRLMAKHEVRRLSVVDEHRKLIGNVAQADAAKHATSRQTGEVNEKISK